MKTNPSLTPKLSPEGKSELAVDLAFAACRSIRFATINAERHGGEYSLNDLLAAHKLATDALKNAGPMGAAQNIEKLRPHGVEALRLELGSAEPSSDLNADWWVWSTAIGPAEIMVIDRNTWKTGVVQKYSRAEWAAAFHSPSNPYRWSDANRVVQRSIDRSPLPLKKRPKLPR